MSAKPKIYCLMGPTASGKTAAALALAEKMPVEVISVDSALVYRDLDIGTAKPSQEELQQVPHHLINICKFYQPYSAGQFVVDATAAIEDILHRGKQPLLVGGTMLYFHALQQGMAKLPDVDPEVRAGLEKRHQEAGLESLYHELKVVDPKAADRIKPTDPQRILRALEVYQIAGKPLSELQRQTEKNKDYDYVNIGLVPKDRQWLHDRIAQRFEQILAQNFEQEVKALMTHPKFNPDLPAMRSVGYRQMILHLNQQLTLEEMKDKAIAATRQLAKRQLTWLRGWNSLQTVFCDGDDMQQNLNSMMHYTS